GSLTSATVETLTRTKFSLEAPYESTTGRAYMGIFRSRLLLVAVCIAALIAGTIISAERSSSAMTTAATAFLNGLSPEQRQKATFPFSSGERLHWNYIPSEAFPRNGLLIKDMNETQRKRAHDLLKSALSQRGYMTAAAIMDLETTLGDIERRARQSGQAAESMVRDPEKYYFSVFGKPSKKET